MMVVNVCSGALSGSESWVRRGLLTPLCVFLLMSLVYSAPVPESDDSLTGNNDLASGEASDPKTNLDEGFDDLVGVKPNDKPGYEVVYRTQTQGVTMPHFVFSTGAGPSVLPPIPKITTLPPIPRVTTARPNEEKLHIDIQGVMTRPAGVFTTAHIPVEKVVDMETTQTTVSTTTTVAETTTAEAADAGVIAVDVDTKDEETASNSTTTTTAAVTTEAEELEPIDELMKTEPPTTTTTTSPPTTTTVEESTEAVVLVPVDTILETEPSTTTTTAAPTTTTTAAPETTTTAEESTVAAGGAVLVGGEKEVVEESTTTTKPTTPSTTPSVVVVIVDGGEDGEPSTTTTTTTIEPTTEEAAEKPVYPGIIDGKEENTDDGDAKYTTPTTTVLAYTTKQPTEEPSSPTTAAAPAEVVPIAEVGLGEGEGKVNETTDGVELQKIVVSIDEEPTVILDAEDEDVNGTLIGESKQEGLSSGARTGIAIACIVGFWIILGPLVCLICKMRDKKRDKKEQEERNAREKASNHLVEEMVKTELQKKPNGEHKKNGEYKKAQYKDETPFDDAEVEPITIGRADSVPYMDADAESRDTEL